MSITICEHCKRKTNTALIDYDQDGKCLATFDDELKLYVKGCGFDTASLNDKESISIFLFYKQDLADA